MNALPPEHKPWALPAPSNLFFGTQAFSDHWCSPLHASLRISFACILYTLCIQGVSAEESRVTLAINQDWKFTREDPSEAYLPHFDISNWRTVAVPHDWSIEDIPGTESPFASTAIGGESTGFTIGGVGWYAKDLSLNRNFRDKRITIEFDGVYQNSDVWINGKHLGNHPNGYTAFVYDLTEHVKTDGTANRLVVRVHNDQPNSRWYSGSGIYRHVSLRATGQIFIPHHGTFVKTSELSDNSALLSVETEVNNSSPNARSVLVELSVENEDGSIVARTHKRIDAKASAKQTVKQQIRVAAPKAWSPERPALYRLRTALRVNATTTDEASTTFGIRTIAFSPSEGFLLNGTSCKLRGGNLHHGNGPLGAREYPRAAERRVALMKSNGFNAIRTAHNPPSTTFLEACDRLGMLVIEEAFDSWIYGKRRNDYHKYFNKTWKDDIASMVRRDRNHPSVIMWSTGNEIRRKTSPDVIMAGQQLVKQIKYYDPTRPATVGVHMGGEDWEAIRSGYMSPYKVVGYNYQPSRYANDFAEYPERLLYGSESAISDMFPYLMEARDKHYVIGDFAWAGFDYLGEAGLGWTHKREYPWTVAYCGDLDLCGFKRPQSYYREVLWDTGKRVAVFVESPKPTFDDYKTSRWSYDDVHPSWTWPGQEGKDMNVHVYSNCESVALTLNGSQIATSKTNRSTQYKAKFRIPYTPGTLAVTGYDGKNIAGECKLQTVADPHTLRLAADRPLIRADGEDLAFVTIEVVDRHGNRHPSARRLIEYEFEGTGGEVIAFGSANPRSIESFQQSRRTCFEGRCLLVVRATREEGDLAIHVTSEGLKPGHITISSKREE
ncbi:MAG: sugar-binding domain-containing protein [Planctomycetota bacterium]